MDTADPADFDQAYFDHWYRHEGFGSPTRLARKVAYAMGSAEYLLDRPVRSVLDVGCGEGSWQPAVRKLRPKVRYAGVDPSAYAVARFGRRRQLRLGGLGDLADAVSLDEGPFDLVVCTDVLGYVGDADAQRGLRAIGAVLGGVAFVDVFTSVDVFEGDVDHYRLRRPATYRRWFADAGLSRVGAHLYAGRAVLPHLSALELPLGRG